jgi:hypothetical protein
MTSNDDDTGSTSRITICHNIDSYDEFVPYEHGERLVPVMTFTAGFNGDLDIAGDLSTSMIGELAFVVGRVDPRQLVGQLHSLALRYRAPALGTGPVLRPLRRGDVVLIGAADENGLAVTFDSAGVKRVTAAKLRLVRVGEGRGTYPVSPEELDAVGAHGPDATGTVACCERHRAEQLAQDAAR